MPCTKIEVGAPEGYDILRYFEYSHLPEYLRDISAPIAALAHDMANRLPHCAETTAAGLRKLLEAKDCFVRARLPCSMKTEDNNGYDILEYFDCSSHLPPMLYEVAAQAETLALAMARDLPHCAETRAGLRKLLEAKDCFVRAKIFAKEMEERK
jgi:hypothetical protein